jgi:hypothetical protein
MCHCRWSRVSRFLDRPYLSLVPFLACLMALLTWPACARAPLLSGVTAQPPRFVAGERGGTTITYRVGRTADVSIYVEDAAGRRYTLRHNVRRAPDEYAFRFDGAVSPPDPVAAGDSFLVERQVLPPGTYTYIVSAQAGSETAELRGTLTITGADTTLPEVRDLDVYPPRFTPNLDGFDDEVKISYVLTKRADVDVYLEPATPGAVATPHPTPANQPGWLVATPAPGTASGKLPRFFIAQQRDVPPGLYQHTWDGGVWNKVVPPPDGDYRLIVRATDSAGNVVRAERRLTIAEGGIPQAQIVSATITPHSVPLGGVVKVEVTVKNTGSVPIRSTGPPPGTQYTSEENFNTKGYYEEPGAFRVGLDYEGNSIGREYPYRWGLGKEYLAPGESVTVVGYLQVTLKTPRPQPHFFVGLVHEDVAKVEDRRFPTKITIGF